MTKTPEFKAWDGVLQRCFNPRCKSYANYGGRGITVCDRWQTSFENFYSDMGPRPKGPPRYTLERVDNDGSYSPENCVWAPYVAQERNKRNSRLITFRGVTRTMSEWALLLGVPRNTIVNRLLRGWSVDRAFIEPVDSRKSSRSRA